MSTRLDNIEEFCIMISGGDYRYRLPGRGIAIIRHYEPIEIVIANAMAEITQVIQSWTRELNDFYKAG